MKVLKTVTLDVEIVERLSKEPNASGLVNDLLKRHYENSKLRSLPRDKLVKLKEKVIVRDQVLKDIEEIMA